MRGCESSFPVVDSTDGRRVVALILLPRMFGQSILDLIWRSRKAGACVAPSTGEAGWSLPLNALFVRWY
ncbi:MAG: hypothetical protein WAO55_06185 [Candidatus Manganitrophaceae bacterium]